MPLYRSHLGADRVRRNAAAYTSRARRAIAVAVGAIALPAAAQSSAAATEEENPTTKLEVERIEVIGTTPLPGIGLPLNQIPANIQSVTGSQLNKLKSPDLSGALNQTVSSVNLNNSQGNPFQADANFRGFTASPVLGTPQGISVFVDGVRANEALGDTVNWDLIPPSSIAHMEVIPGSNPLFGLNTLGGALTVTTKSGFEFPGTSVQAYRGSYDRRGAVLETGGHGENIDYYVNGNVFDERGWADHNPSHVKELFAKTGYQDKVTDIDLSFNWASNRLEGSQTLPVSFLDDLNASYTWPDIQTDRFAFVNLKASHFLSDAWLLSSDLFYRKLSTDIFNSNVDNNFDPTQPVGAGNMPAQNVVNHIDERRQGASFELTSLGPALGHKNNATLGASAERGTVDFTQLDQAAPFASDRSTFSGAPFGLATRLAATNDYAGLYATDTLAIDSKLSATFSGRYNHARIALQDRTGTALDGEHTFGRFNPAAGLTFNPVRDLTAYLSYNEGMRVPTAVELTCADRNAPCSLPNAFASDPALKPVVSRTVEAGARGKIGDSTTWSAAVFRTRLDDDIQFISAGGGAISAGFFQNVGRTLRQGLETGLQTRSGPLELALHYSFIDATFRTPLVINSPSNSTAAPISCPTCTDIQVVPGDRLPGVPRQILKLRLQYAPSDRFEAGFNVIAQSSTYARGDENNLDRNGPLPGFAVVSVDARFDLTPAWELSGRIGNLLNRHYSTFGQLGQNVFSAPGRGFDPTGASWRAEQFRAIAPPLEAWAGITYRFEGGDAH